MNASFSVANHSHLYADTAIELCQLARSENARRNQEHALAAFLHTEHYSLFAVYSP
jgi:hypothetical protein